jgi:hypothetical protein
MAVIEVGKEVEQQRAITFLVKEVENWLKFTQTHRQKHTCRSGALQAIYDTVSHNPMATNTTQSYNISKAGGAEIPSHIKRRNVRRYTEQGVVFARCSIRISAGTTAILSLRFLVIFHSPLCHMLK